MLTGGPPQARATGMAMCVCLVAGLMAARIMDPCIHGGMIMLGEFTVLIGG